VEALSHLLAEALQELDQLSSTPGGLVQLEWPVMAWGYAARSHHQTVPQNTWQRQTSSVANIDRGDS
jgi:hypothetical protein